MPNGGSDHCGNCRHNRINIGRESTREERRGPAFCTIRQVEIRASGSTYCANHAKSLRTPLGPLYVSPHDAERIPYHGTMRPHAGAAARCAICGVAAPASEGVRVADPSAGELEFCGPRHYVQWWKRVHPGETLPWDCDRPKPSVEQQREIDARAMLELARAYLQAGDVQGAREVLEEAGRDAPEPMRGEARALLVTLPKA